MVSAALLIIAWAIMYFIFKTGEVAHVMLAVAGVMILFRYTLRHVIT